MVTKTNTEYNEGYDAGKNGQHEDDCPYEKGTKQEADWLGGWEQADYELTVEEDDEED